MAELPIDLDRVGRKPLAAQIYTAIRETIETGRLGAGARLPSWRDLAAQLGVSRRQLHVFAERPFTRIETEAPLELVVVDFHHGPFVRVGPHDEPPGASACPVLRAPSTSAALRVSWTTFAATPSWISGSGAFGVPSASNARGSVRG